MALFFISYAKFTFYLSFFSKSIIKSVNELQGENAPHENLLKIFDRNFQIQLYMHHNSLSLNLLPSQDLVQLTGPQKLFVFLSTLWSINIPISWKQNSSNLYIFWQWNEIIKMTITFLIDRVTYVQFFFLWIKCCHMVIVLNHNNISPTIYAMLYS